MSTYIDRKIENVIKQNLARGKSILLLGPRQTGKTTLIKNQINPDISYSFAKVSQRQRYEKDPSLLERELEEEIKAFEQPPIIFIDEVQKIPAVMDIAQSMIDDKLAQFILTGSSARKLKHGSELNLLPGRVVALSMTPLLYDELPSSNISINDILLYGTLPGIITEESMENREVDLYSYVTTYLEEEIRAEAAVRNVGAFARFLELAAGESGKQINFTTMAQDIGISDTTIANYYQILEDCLITTRIEPITNGKTKRRLLRSPKHLFFDLGVRRAAANEGLRLPQSVLGDLFEHYVGIELLNQSYLSSPEIKLRYWRDANGPEIDFVLDIAHKYVPIEIKWSDKPNMGDAKHLIKFLDEYEEAKIAYIVSRSPKRYNLAENIKVIPWQEISLIFDNIE